MRILIILIIFLLSNSIYGIEKFSFSGILKCEISATYIVFDFDNKIAIRNNYDSLKYKLSNYETIKNKFKNTIHSFTWYDLKNNFLGYWILSDDSKKIQEIKFDKNGEIFFINRICSSLDNKNIGELIWE